MGFPGGKAGAGTYQKIINQIPPHSVYVEAFLGSGAIMERKLPADLSIGIDLNERTARSTAARLCGLGRLRVHHACGIEWLKHHFGLYCVGPRRQMGRHFQEPPAAECLDPRSTFVYLDPPYLLSTRLSGAIYEHELTVQQHVELLDIAKRLPCMVAISGYWSPLYNAALEDWRHIAFNVQTRGGRKAREVVWFNYPQPTALHDYRYLGDNKRQRERIARKVRTWAAGLKRLPRLERQAILDRLSRDDAAGSRVA